MCLTKQVLFVYIFVTSYSILKHWFFFHKKKNDNADLHKLLKIFLSFFLSHCSSSRTVTPLTCPTWSTVSVLDQPRQAAHVWHCAKGASVLVPAATFCANVTTCCAPSPPSRPPPPRSRPLATGAVPNALRANRSLTASGPIVRRGAWASQQAALGVRGRWTEAPWAPSNSQLGVYTWEVCQSVWYFWGSVNRGKMITWNRLRERLAQLF